MIAPATGRFRAGDRVKVRFEDRPGHIRTPWYVRGKTGRIEQVYGDFLNPESLGHGGDGLPKRTLYLVAFAQSDVWDSYPKNTPDKVLVDIYDHWLDKASLGGEADD